jgi:hypothetical protein
MEIEKTDKFISFQDTRHDNPYDDPEVLKIEDIFGFMMAYRKPYNTNSRKSLKNYRNRLTKHCRGCVGFPDKCSDDGTTDKCRVFYLKEAMTREIRGLKVIIVGGTAKVKIY